MGREKGQRVKGNLKPASSGRTAELLQNQNITFSALSGGSIGTPASFVPLIPDSEETGLDAQLTLTLRKLGKKDSTTKIKALTELLDLSKEDASLPSLILPFWPKLYVRLSSDESRKVRELSNLLLQHITRAVGRNLAPYTKTLLPPWFVAQSDTFPPAASAAFNAFVSVFPTEDKQVQALNFCSGELCAYLKERVEGSEEFDKFTALNSMSRILDYGLPLDELLGQLFKNNKFWAFGQDESSLVRRTFYQLLTSLSEKCSHLIPKSKLKDTLTKCFEVEKIELQQLWNCFLSLTLHGVFEEKKIATEQVVLCCSNGFYGNASRLGPLILPLVAKIGVEANALFTALENGYKNEKSMSERQCILKTYAEVLSYVFKETETVPAQVFPFITSDLKQAAEFGRTVSTLIQNEKFYTELSDYISISNESALRLPEFGSFLLSFIKDKNSVKFGSSNNGEKEDKYSGVRQKNFLISLSKKLVEVENFGAFSQISRYFSCELFYRDLFPDSTSQNMFQDIFRASPENKVQVLKIGLDLVKFYPTSPSALSVLSNAYEFFKETDLEGFFREIEGFENLKQLKNWLRMENFMSNIPQNSKSATKFIIRKSNVFTQEVRESKIASVCENIYENLDVVYDLILCPGSKEDIMPIFTTIWETYLKKLGLEDDESEKLEELSMKILERDYLPKNLIYEKISTAAQNSETLDQINLLSQIFIKIAESEEDFEIGEISTKVDGDLLAFLGLKFPKLRAPSDISPPHDFKIERILKKCIYEGKIGAEILADFRKISQLTSNLVYAKALFDIFYKYSLGCISKIVQELGQEVATILKTFLEKITVSETDWAEFTQIIHSKKDSVWDSKYPLQFLNKFLKSSKIQDRVLKIPSQIESFTSLDLKNIESLFTSADKLSEIVPISSLVEQLTKKRLSEPGCFHFETPFMEVSTKQDLINLLHLTIIALEEESFISTGACWISSWAQNIGKVRDSDTKYSYLMLLLLSKSVVKLHQLATINTSFTEEYVEFHAPKIFPLIYAQFIENSKIEEKNDKNEKMSIWASLTCQVLSEAVAWIPSTILKKLEPNPAVVFSILSPVIIQREEYYFKISVYKLMRKVRIEEEILPKELENYFKKLRRVEYTDSVNLTYLLLWDALLYAQPNSFELANYVKEPYLLPNILSLIFFTLLPDSPKFLLESETQLSFYTPPSLSTLSSSVLLHILRCLPYTVRWWWSSLPKARDKAGVEKIATQHLSAKLAAEELGRVKWSSEDENVTVNCHPGCNELNARYKIEETSVLLSLTLPLNHPLGPVSVKISDKKLHARISQLLNTRSHSLAAGLKLWKESLDSLYKDVDECAICYFILHNSTKQIPKMGCKTCRKKFHSNCLYKWFSSSNKSECPLCRNLW